MSTHLDARLEGQALLVSAQDAYPEQRSTARSPAVRDREPTEALRPDRTDALLRLDRGCLARYEAQHDGLWRQPYDHIARSVSRRLRAALERIEAAEHLPLVDVAAHYGTLTYRAHPQTPLQLARTFSYLYSAWLLSLWIWDDLVDTNRVDQWIDPRALAEAIDLIKSHFTADASHASHEPSADAPAPRVEHVLAWPPHMRKALRDSCLLLREVYHAQSELFADMRAEPLAQETAVFFDAFLEKAQGAQHASPNVDTYAENRARCVGMFPCYEFSALFKSAELDIPSDEIRRFADDHAEMVHRCATLATLHCAAVNDLFSAFKDRELEDTENFPSALATSCSTEGYFDGFMKTIEYVGTLHTQFKDACRSLPSHRVADVLIDIWTTMMEGNLMFHLTVPRYREGVALVRDVLDSPDDYEARQRRFCREFS